MLPSGYLIRPCEGGGSIIHIVDHMDLEVAYTLFIFFPQSIISFLLNILLNSMKKANLSILDSLFSHGVFQKYCVHCMNHPLFLLKR